MVGVVFGHLIGAGFAVGAACQCGQASALSEELIDTVDAVLVDVAGGGVEMALQSRLAAVGAIEADLHFVGQASRQRAVGLDR